MIIVCAHVFPSLQLLKMAVTVKRERSTNVSLAEINILTDHVDKKFSKQSRII